jgi:CRP-like cAMP-binding protein
MPTDIANKIHTELSRFPKRTYPKGQILIFADESPDYIFYIVKGKVRKYDVSYRGEEIVINIFKPPAFFPMSWALNHTENKYFYKAETEVELHIVPASDARKFLENNPDVTLDLLSRIYTGLEGVYGRLTHLMSGTARSRLTYEIIIECRRFGKKQDKTGYLLSVNEADLAARSGLSRETVSREFGKLKERDWLHFDGKVIVITDLERLEASLGSQI